MKKQLDVTQGLLRAATGIAWEWYRAGEEWQLMPFPGEKGNEHPFWDWYCFKRKQFFTTQFEAAAMLLQHWRAWHGGAVSAAYDKNHGPFRAMDFATARERKEFNRLHCSAAIKAINLRDEADPDSREYKTLMKLVDLLTQFPHLRP